MLALNQEYPTKDSAFFAIQTQVKDFYESRYPEIWETRKADIEKATLEIQDGYANNIFPVYECNLESLSK